MKKLILLLSILMVGQVQAQEMMAPRIYATADAACYYLTYQESSALDIISCVARETTNIFNYGPGWSQYVKADIKLKAMGSAIQSNPIKSVYGQEEAKAMSMTIAALSKMWNDSITELQKYPEATRKLSPEQLKGLRY